MGCYGIGVSRLIPAILEQNYDENGIIWPGEVAPFDIIILPLEVGKKKVYETGLNVYNNLKKRGFEVLLDDRDERAGIKFKDADLVGIPIQVIIGEKLFKENKLELKIRRTGERVIVDKSKLLQEIRKVASRE
jgi:prolyl-tRNA synthetase